MITPITIIMIWPQYIIILLIFTNLSSPLDDFLFIIKFDTK